MAPSTRLQVHPERRINYAESSRSKQIRRNNKKVQPFNNVKRKRTPRVMTGAVMKVKAESRMPPMSSESEKNPQPETQDCLLCTETKESTSNFNAPENACEHFRAICKKCVDDMLKAKTAGRPLEDVKLRCPYSECNHDLDFKTLRTLVDEATFKAYDIAITKHLLSTNKSFMSCISIGCGLAFSIEGTNGNKICKQWVECPYCDFEICMECNRPWTEHRDGGCDQIKLVEDQKSVAKIEEMGAKPCPRCGVNIEKHGGCNHMRCAKCRHHFCWKCLTEYLGHDACECQRAALQNAPINQRK